MTERVVELGLVDAEAAAALGREVPLDQTLDYFAESDGQAVLRVLDALEIWYDIGYKTFRGVCEFEDQLYREQLDRIAARTRGLLTVTDVELVDDEDGDHLLRFRCNGEPREWRIPHDDEEEEEFSATMEFTMGISKLVPAGSPARWCGVDIDDADFGPQFVFGDPVALRQLGSEFGLKFRA
ncbi:hypothetical protein RB614_32645 [Phytohabitans sp. ZYX-F-186]|uniref:Uncharacterized protein n=1 Tax=Phytohabitans maris TaxID=3071409 RepID=A0ABU0ZQJ7_9ACTN|nr:hypothetical protein [Phytohabitans sp. ZYX-F-186]MDQ7909280.1 hypothetical protein [Phytohabitans sp. ZYX-F-186]